MVIKPLAVLNSTFKAKLDINMRLTDSQVTVTTFKDTLATLLPQFGKQGVPDIPRFNCGYGLYLVNQWLTDWGNRYLTYVGLSKEIIIEVQVVLHHSAVYFQWLNIANTLDYKFFVANAYFEKTHFSTEFLREELKTQLTEYVTRNHTAEGMTEDQITAHVHGVIDEILNHKPVDLDRRGLRPILVEYCKSRNYCKDFTDEFIDF